ncbi:hypothetical protein OG705_30180 [Streptomyces sp. NBC_00838]|uniref:hypothetical protein n=1 Tax=Streptomyces sp. NBC_00838 TaxID=2903680 RepID=UPI003869B107|nr:hypothetical protein OG705_30180 [Streptomyces sp. NBC_00838]
MNHDDNTHRNDAPDAELPKFSVNVVPTDQITREDLRVLLSRYRRGRIEPMVFGDGGKPEAAIIPFAAFVRLLKHDHADTNREESAFRGELQRRIQESDASDEPGVTLEEVGDELGEPARSLIRKVLDDDE